MKGKSSMNFKKALATFLAVISVFSLMLPVAGAVQDDSPEVIYIGYGEASEYGYAPVTAVDGDGNEVELETLYSLDMMRRSSQTDADLPTAYDSRDKSVITSAKSQGVSGNCWSFSAMSALESDSIMQGIADKNANFSEAHNVWFSYTPTTDTSSPVYADSYGDVESPYLHGGNWRTVLYSLSNWSGIAKESSFPFYPNNVSGMGNYAESDRFVADSGVVVSSAEVLTGASDVKEWITEHGSAVASLYYNKEYLSASNAYYYSGSETANHQITVIGWNDEYSASNFSSQPPENGAWLCKNSWGTSWGDNGCFWVSYYDSMFGDFVGFTTASYDKNKNNYSYNGAGYSANINNEGSASLANIFKAKDNELVCDVATYLITGEQTLNISVYTDLPDGYTKPTDGTLAESFTTEIKRAGYHTIALPEKVSVKADTYFSVVVEFVNPDGTSCIPIECEYEEYGYSYSCGEKESYLLLSQYSSAWKTTSAFNPDFGNVCVQAITEMRDKKEENKEENETPTEPTTFTLGSYPQSKVTDTKTLEALNAMELEWTYYEYYAGTDTSRPYTNVIGSAKQLDFMKYCDVEYNGEKYRAVYYEKLRPNSTGQVPLTDSNSNLRYKYKVDTVYWYKFEPVEWTYLDYENGVAISSLVLDSQPFNEFVAYSDGNYYNSTSKKYYADDYAYSSLRAWLNDDFYNTVFTTKEKAEIVKGGITENDNVSILSEEDVLNTAYGFNSSAAVYDEARLKKGTDYASSQGLTYSGTESENITVACNWRVRPTASTGTSYDTTAVNFKGNVAQVSICSTITGIIPAIKLKKQQEGPDVKYTITFNANGGVFSTGLQSYSCEYKSGDSIVLPDAPTKKGYTFAGWDIEIPDTMPAESLSALAKWTANTYTVTFVLNENEFIFINQKYASQITAPADPVREGYTFTGWVPAVPTRMPENGATCVAQWKINEYEAAFDAAGGKFADGNTTATVKANYGEAIAAPEAPTKTGYIFKGWTPEVGTMPVGGASFTAVYEANIYDAVFDANGGKWSDNSSKKTVPTAFDSQITAPENPTRQGYVFSKWSSEVGKMDNINGKTFSAVWIPESDTHYTVETYTMNTDGEYVKATEVKTGTTDTLVNAKPETVATGFSLNDTLSVYEGTVAADNSLVLKIYLDRNSHEVKTVLDGTVVSNTSYYYGATVTIPEKEEKEGYTFNGWYIENKEYTPDSTFTMPDKDVTINGTFTVNTYDALFYSDNKLVATVPTEFGKIPVTPTAPTKTGYTFKCWTPDLSAMTVGGAEYHAVFTSNGNTPYTVETYIMDTKGEYGTPDISTSYGETDTTVTLTPKNIDGFTIANKSVLSGKILADGSLVLKIYYSRNKYAISLVANGTPCGEMKTYYYGEEITIKDVPEKTGYAFTGWTPEVPETMPASEMTFTAVFEANIYNAVFDANGGKWSDNSSKKTVPTAFDSQITAPENPTRQGYIFSKWSSDVGKMDSINGKTFSAVWIPESDTHYTVETYTMNTVGEYEKTSQAFTGTTDETANAEYTVPTGFTLNSEKSVLSGKIKADNSLVLKVYIDRNKYAFTTVVDGAENTTEYYYGSLLTAPATPTKSGYKFVKWNGDIPETMPASGVKITAEFIKSYSCPDCGKEILGEEAINAHIAEEKLMKSTVTIKNNGGSKTINYGETLRLTAVASSSEYVNIYWYVDGVKKGEGEKFDVKFSSGTKTVEAKLADANGNILKNKNDSEISASEKVTVNAGIWQKIVSFFKNLFGANRVVVQ